MIFDAGFRLHKQRTKPVEALPTTRTVDVLGRQLIRSGTPIGANYRSACRGRSTADLIAKLWIAEEEADESIYGMEPLVESKLVQPAQISELLRETDEIIAMTVASIKTLQKETAVLRPIENRK